LRRLDLRQVADMDVVAKFKVSDYVQRVNQPWLKSRSADGQGQRAVPNRADTKFDMRYYLHHLSRWFADCWDQP